MRTEAIRLGVNVDHVATLRQARKTQYPDPVRAALMAEEAGAHQITVHLREDRRHIQERDVEILKEVLEIDLNLEIANTPEMIEFAQKIKPAYCCLVPEKREELTTEGGLDVIAHFDTIKKSIASLEANQIKVSLFIDANIKQIEAAFEAGARIIEIHTGHYADALTKEETEERLNDIKKASEFAERLGIRVHAGHGLHYRNTLEIAKIPQIKELNIGHAIVGEAILSGMHEAVSRILDIMEMGRLC
ncbi:MAG: pyridoxine 5'-phosphate synthase [Candidatus Berkiella sp.]